MSRRSLFSSTDAAKWGFFSQLGQLAAKNVYQSVQDSSKYFIDTNSALEEKKGKVDANGYFTYDGYECASFWKYIGLLLGIAILPPIIAPILFFKGLIRFISGKVRFFSITECDVYEISTKKYVGKTPAKVPFKKSFSESKYGINSSSYKHPILRTTIDNILYIALAILGGYWTYCIYTTYKANEAQITSQENFYTQWHDTIIVDSFTNEIIDEFSYIVSRSNKKFAKDVILINRNNKFLIYTSSSFLLDEDDDVKICTGNASSIIKLGDEDFYSTNQINMHYGTLGSQEYSSSFTLDKKQYGNISKADSMIIRHATLNGDTFFTFKFTNED